MNLHDFHMEVTASERRCKCFGCKNDIAPKTRHLRLQSVDKSYCFKLCETCLQEAVFSIQEAPDIEIKLIRSRREKVDCESCDKNGETTCGNDLELSCYEGSR